MKIVLIVLIIIDWVVFNYTFKYQRTTLELSRMHLGTGNAHYQAILSPTWLGLVGWLVNLLHLAPVILFFLIYGWIWALLYLLISFLGFGAIDAFIAFPTKKYYFQLIKKSLKNDINKTKNKKQKITLKKVLKEVTKTEKKKKLTN